MTRFIALLRGINISGKNKITMPDLKDLFLQEGYANVRTHLNSGNVLFDTEETDCEALAHAIEDRIRERFSLDIPVLVILQKDLQELLEKAPAWWGTEDKAVYDNLIFLFPGYSFEEIHEAVGEPTEGIEQIRSEDHAIFWSFDLKLHSKANWWKKTAAAGIGEKMTIRTAGTVRKLAVL